MNCANFGNVSGYKQVGGCIVSFYGQTSTVLFLRKSTNTGFVSGSYSIGGFIGNVSAFQNNSSVISFEGCESAGQVSGERSLGGYVGIMHDNTNI